MIDGLEPQFKTIFETAQDGIAVVSEKGVLAYFNKAFTDMLGYTPEELKKLSYIELTPKEFVHLDEQALKQALECGYYDEFEKEYVRKDGSRVPVILTGGIIGGKPQSPEWLAFAFIKDISIRKQLEDELRKKLDEFESMQHINEKRYKKLIDQQMEIIRLKNKLGEQPPTMDEVEKLK